MRSSGVRRGSGPTAASSKISLIGGLSGPATELNPGLIFARRATAQGISVGTMQMFEAMNRAIAANGIKPVIDKVFGFDEVHAAYKHMASGLPDDRASRASLVDCRGHLYSGHVAVRDAVGTISVLNFIVVGAADSEERARKSTNSSTVKSLKTLDPKGRLVRE